MRQADPCGYYKYVDFTGFTDFPKEVNQLQTLLGFLHPLSKVCAMLTEKVNQLLDSLRPFSTVRAAV